MANLNLNKVILAGRLTATPELRQTPSNIPVTSFTVAVNRNYSKSEDAQNTPADFINVVAWRQTAEFVTRYFRKGSSICVVGSIQTRSWTDQQGNKRYATDVVADEIKFVDSKSESRDSAAQGYMPSQYGNEPQYATPAGNTPASNVSVAPEFEELSNDDDLPF